MTGVYTAESQNRQHEKLLHGLIGCESNPDESSVSFLQLYVCHEANGEDGGGVFPWPDMRAVQMVDPVRIYLDRFDRQYGERRSGGCTFPSFSL